MIPYIRIIILVVLSVAGCHTSAQSYTVERAPFSSDRDDEYSPSYFRNGLVFCSGRRQDIVKGASSGHVGSVNLWFVPAGDSAGPDQARILAVELVTGFHDGPATFSPDGDVIYYSRNLEIDSERRDVFDSQNQLGLFSAEWIDGTWSRITPFAYNSAEYSITTPALSADGNRIYFASDMPGGVGGADLWYCDRKDDEWLPPVNMGQHINTPGNESYPFESASGILYFASDGLGGFGKKDIFFSTETDGEWIRPVHLDRDINSRADDFGLITDLNGSTGYFSSNRKRGDDIYRFLTVIPPFHGCDSIRENYYCYLFYDESFTGIDSLPLRYEWSFGDGIRIPGTEVEHCFPGPGNYVVSLNIVDNNTGNTFFTQSSYEVEITDAIQPYISSPDAFLKNRKMEFSGLNSNLPGMEITGYYWDFGDGAKAGGAEQTHLYERKGNYHVRLGVTGAPDSSGLIPRECVFKEVVILEDNQELATYQAMQRGELPQVEATTGSEPPVSQSLYSMQQTETEEAVYRVEVLSSGSRIDIDTSLFDPLRGAYDIREVFLREDSLYSYTVGESSTVLGTYAIYNDVVEKGYQNAQVKSYVLADLAEEELLQLTATLGEFADAYFEFDDYRVGEASYPILDRVVDIMTRYPSIRLEIAAHTDNMGSFEYNIELSQKRAQSMVDYLVSKGIGGDRLEGKGYGESRPIASNNTEEGRMINRRVEFIILDEGN